MSDSIHGETGTLSLNVPNPPTATDRSGQPSAPGGRWCPYCGADLSAIPDRDAHQDEALFAQTGRRLKIALAVAFVLVWITVSLYDWLSEPAALVIPGWFSALGALMLFYLLGFNPWGLMRRR